MYNSFVTDKRLTTSQTKNSVFNEPTTCFTLEISNILPVLPKLMPMDIGVTSICIYGDASPAFVLSEVAGQQWVAVNSTL
jgi:hypothetical protein